MLENRKVNYKIDFHKKKMPKYQNQYIVLDKLLFTATLAIHT